MQVVFRCQHVYVYVIHLRVSCPAGLHSGTFPCLLVHHCPTSLQFLFPAPAFHPVLHSPHNSHTFVLHLQFPLDGCQTFYLSFTFFAGCVGCVLLQGRLTPSIFYTRASVFRPGGRDSGGVSNLLACQLADGLRLATYVPSRLMQVFTVSASPIACLGTCFSRGRVLAARAGLVHV